MRVTMTIRLSREQEELPIFNALAAEFRQVVEAAVAQGGFPVPADRIALWWVLVSSAAREVPVV